MTITSSPNDGAYTQHYRVSDLRLAMLSSEALYMLELAGKYGVDVIDAAKSLSLCSLHVIAIIIVLRLQGSVSTPVPHDWNQSMQHAYMHVELPSEPRTRPQSPWSPENVAVSKLEYHCLQPWCKKPCGASTNIPESRACESLSSLQLLVSALLCRDMNQALSLLEYLDISYTVFRPPWRTIYGD
jgi:hypothetical protein